MKKDISTCRMPGSRGYVPDVLPNHLVTIPCWGPALGRCDDERKRKFGGSGRGK